MNAQSPDTRASLRMAEAASLTGRWTVTVTAGKDCRIELLAARLESANAHLLADESGCLAALAGAPVAGWRPAPDGIEIAAADRRTLLSFADQGDGTAIAATPGGQATLSRAAD
ncbi:AprI/Inh family metalloprotease inhibitor [Sphingomonas spermidinifaciens]|uniref:AprI/Inh family metalloprotease inhibitor n=1 Tax=Sphingomonas spermidinifaciens TaxID=1141889 RepID=UPI0015968F89|nr:AprI/Inh family metalloprotease inhibitor [Sphingomonas spermidinifaciens]